jgi:hypothetical protein
VREFVLLLGDVVGLQGRRRDFDGVGKYLSSVLDLFCLIFNRFAFIENLRVGVGGLGRVVDEG